MGAAAMRTSPLGACRMKLPLAAASARAWRPSNVRSAACAVVPSAAPRAAVRQMIFSIEAADRLAPVDLPPSLHRCGSALPLPACGRGTSLKVPWPHGRRGAVGCVQLHTYSWRAVPAHLPRWLMVRVCQRRLGRGNADVTHNGTRSVRARLRPGPAGIGHAGTGGCTADRQRRITGQGTEGQPGAGRRHRTLPRRAPRPDRGGRFEAGF
ncbi:hypothetical protein D3C73_724920 [compost metagenome]